MATLKDIARQAGVSMMTVSRALNSPEQVSEALRNTILEVSEDLDYVPHHGARSMASNKTGIVQIITGLKTTDFYFMTLFAGIADYLSEHQYAIIIEHNYKTSFKCDGTIVMSLHTDESKAFLKTLKDPCVLFGKDEGVDWIDINNEQGMRISVEHLAACGHEKIAYIGVDSKERFAKERLDGFIDTMKALNLHVDERHIVSCKNTNLACEALADQLLEDDTITAIACATDTLAMAVMNVARKKMIRIPEDISIIGFDGVYLQDVTVPKMTTIVQPVYSIGRKLAEIMLLRIKDPDMDFVHTIVDTRLSPGESVRKVEQ